MNNPYSIIKQYLNIN